MGDLLVNHVGYEAGAGHTPRLVVALEAAFEVENQPENQGEITNEAT